MAAAEGHAWHASMRTEFRCPEPRAWWHVSVTLALGGPETGRDPWSQSSPLMSCSFYEKLFQNIG